MYRTETVHEGSSKGAGKAPVRGATEAASRRLRILIVEEEVGHLEFVLRALRDLEADVAFSIELGDALEKIEANDPDLVVLDMKPPGSIAIAVCRALAARTDLKRPPFLLITEYDDETARLISLEVGADDRLSRPYVAFELRARIRALVRQRHLQEMLAAAQSGLEEAKGRVQRLERLRRFLPPEIVTAVLGEGGEDLFALPRRKEVTIVFSDVRNFTSISDQLEPEEVKVMLDVYLTAMTSIVEEHGGSVNKVLGDGLLAIFNDPVPVADHALRALKAALAMKSRAQALQAELHSVLPEEFHIGVGVNTGAATIASLACGDRMDYTAVGSTVNLAARLQGLSANNSILAAAATYEPLGARVKIKDERREPLKGFAHAVRVAEILAIE